MIAGLIVALVGLTACLPLLSDATTLGAAARVVAATAAVGVLPGAAVIAWWWRRATLGLLEFLAISIALSFGIVHLLTVAVILAHGGIPLASHALLVAIGAAALLAWRRPGTPLRIRIDADDVLGLALLSVLAVALYIHGSPVSEWEDQVHASIVRRLASLDRLTLDNFYLTPHLVYTYPFPSTHAFLAFVADLARLDPLFVYLKLRFFWGPAAILMIYLGALAVFGNRAWASVSVVTAALLTLNGMFAAVASYWGQLATYSHASDVAMAVLLPALLALTYRYLESDQPTERPLLFAGIMALAFTLVVVHIRELVQYFAYLGWYLVIVLICAQFRFRASRVATLFAGTLAVAVVFLAWHGHAVAHITDLVAAQRGKLVGIARATSTHDLWLTPAARVLPTFVQWIDAPFNGVTPLLLFVSPVAIVAFRQRSLMWLFAASTVTYLIVMNIPALAIPYIYVTYYEILFTPVRNIIPFLHMLAGPALCVVAAWVWTVTPSRLAAAAVLVVLGSTLGVVAHLSPITANQSELRFFAPLALAWAGTLVYFGRTIVPALTRPRALVLAAAAVVAAVALWPDHAPTPAPVYVNVRWADGVNDDQRTQLERRFSLVEFDRTDRPDTRVYQITDLSAANAQAIVTNRAVRDTHHINRDTFEIEQPAPPWDRYPGRRFLVLTAVVLWVCAFVFPPLLDTKARAADAIRRFADAPFWWRTGVYGLLFVPFMAVTWSARASPATAEYAHPFGYASTPGALLRQTDCVERDGITPPLAETFRGGVAKVPIEVSCPPDQMLVDWVGAHVSVNAVFAVDRWNGYLPTVFLPQQVDAFSGFEVSLPNEEEIYPAYVRWYRASIRERGVQPFFNDQDTPAERRAFLRDLGVTHVLVDPQYYSMLHSVLDALPEVVTRRYDDGRWAVYEVRQDAVNASDHAG